MLLTVVGPALAYAISQIDPLLFSLNLATISNQLDVPANRMGFLGGAATLVVAALVLAVGNLGDRYGLKRLLVYGLVASAVVNGLSMLVPSYELLLVARFLDGIALTALLGLSLALLTVSVPAAVRPAAIGIMMALTTLLYGVTPLLSGWLVETLGWRSLFLVSPALALVGLVFTVRHTIEQPRQQLRELDVLGVVLFGVALLGLVYGLGGAANGFAEPQVWVPLSVTVLVLAVFVRHERRVVQPALDLSLFRSGAFVVAVLAVVTLNFLGAGLSTVLGQFGTYVLQLPSRTIGLLYLPGTLLVAVASIMAGRVMAATTARPVLVVGLSIMGAAGLVMAATASITMATMLLVLVVWLTNLGGFVTATGSSDTVVSHATAGKTGSVAAVYPAFGMTGFAIGPAVYLFLLNLMFQAEWQADAEARGVSTKTAQSSVDAVTGSLSSTPGGVGYDPALLKNAAGLALDVDYTNGLRLTYLIVSAVPLLVAVLAFFLMPRKARPD
jgi:MFS family permease